MLAAPCVGEKPSAALSTGRRFSSPHWRPPQPGAHLQAPLGASHAPFKLQSMAERQGQASWPLSMAPASRLPSVVMGSQELSTWPRQAPLGLKRVKLLQRVVAVPKAAQKKALLLF